jgi:hypothetical protein
MILFVWFNHSFTLTTSGRNLTNTTRWFIHWKRNTYSTIFTCHMRTKCTSVYGKPNIQSKKCGFSINRYLDMYQSLYKKHHLVDTYTYSLSVLHLKVNSVLVHHKAWLYMDLKMITDGIGIVRLDFTFWSGTICHLNRTIKASTDISIGNISSYFTFSWTTWIG